MTKSKWKTAMGNAIDAAKDSIDERGDLEGHEVQSSAQIQRSAAFLHAAAGKRRQVVEYSVDPARCRMWHYHNRLKDFVTRENTAELIESIRANGQRQPALARELEDDPDFDYELIYGARRRFACEEAGKELRIRVTRMDDKQALAEMDAENRPRLDISDYERALDYRRWLEDGIYSNQNELGAAIGVSKSWLSRVLKLADLPEEIIEAFGSPLDVKVEYGYDLSRALTDKTAAPKIKKEAAQLARSDLSAAQVYRRLIASTKERPKQSRGVLETVSNEQGTPLFKIARDRNGQLQFRFEKQASSQSRKEVERAVMAAIERFL
jgi:ParB family chromosome partitioning protein